MFFDLCQTISWHYRSQLRLLSSSFPSWYQKCFVQAHLKFLKYFLWKRTKISYDGLMNDPFSTTSPFRMTPIAIRQQALAMLQHYFNLNPFSCLKSPGCTIFIFRLVQSTVLLTVIIKWRIQNKISLANNYANRTEKITKLNTIFDVCAKCVRK